MAWAAFAAQVILAATPTPTLTLTQVPFLFGPTPTPSPVVPFNPSWADAYAIGTKVIFTELVLCQENQIFPGVTGDVIDVDVDAQWIEVDLGGIISKVMWTQSYAIAVAP